MPPNRVPFPSFRKAVENIKIERCREFDLDSLDRSFIIDDDVEKKEKQKIMTIIFIRLNSFDYNLIVGDEVGKKGRAIITIKKERKSNNNDED